MEMPPLKCGDLAKSNTLCLQKGTYAGKQFSVELTACTNPFCNCTNMKLWCFPMVSDSTIADAPLIFTLDLSERKVQEIPEQPSASDALRLSEELVAEMSGQDWQDLYLKFYLYKQAQTDRIDCATLKVAFPSEVMNDPNIMVLYKDIFPWAKEFSIIKGEEYWIINDQYCVNPECGCQEVVIDFVLVSNSPNCQPEVVKQMPPARFDFHCRTYKPLNPPWKGKPALETLITDLCEVNSDVVLEFQERHRKLRLLYKNVMTMNFRDTPRSHIQLYKGMPNEPCPCGSNKKYKKCCGRVT